jgi:serine/threonine protein kinase
MTIELNNIIHDGILDYKLSFTENQSAYFGFELMEGGSMAGILKDRFPYGIKDISAIATIMKNMLEGINYLHNNMIFHRHACLTQRCESEQYSS